MKNAVIIGSIMCAAACVPALPKSPTHFLFDTVPGSASAMTLDSRIVEIPVRGKVTVVDFWATFCAPCVEMMPGLEKVWREGRAVVIGVAADDNPGHVKAFLQRMGVTYPVVLDGQSGMFQGKFRVSSLPQTFVFDRRGRLRIFIPAGDNDHVSKIRRAVNALEAERD